MSANKKILFIVPHRIGRSPGQRFRFEHFLPNFDDYRFAYTYSNIISAEDDLIFYSKGKLLHKFIILLQSIKKRLSDLKRIRDYDLVYIYREALMLGSTYFEKKYAKAGAKIIFDFDDSIWLNDVSDGNKNLKWLKKPSKTANIIKHSNLVFAGNKYLANYASKYSNNVVVFPTLINTEYHKKLPFEKDKKLCIGWTGTSTTLKHFETAIPFLNKLYKKFKDKIYFKVIVDVPFTVESLDLDAKIWNKNTEIEDLSEIDIGIMPLPDDEWSRGKCGFKGLQYMSMEISTIMSPVGVNQEIIEHGQNGYLAGTDEEWLTALTELIQNDKLRAQIGQAGRKTVLKKYSVESHREIFFKHLDELISGGKHN